LIVRARKVADGSAVHRAAAGAVWGAAAADHVLGRALTGTTNFSAVCVAEKLTTLTSTRPAALPASITARSEISGRPFGRTIHNAPSGLSDVLSFSRRASWIAFVTP